MQICKRDHSDNYLNAEVLYPTPIESLTSLVLAAVYRDKKLTDTCR